MWQYAIPRWWCVTSSFWAQAAIILFVLLPAPCTESPHSVMRLIPALVTVVTVGILILGSILVLRLPEMLSERTPWDSNVPGQSKASLTGGVISAKMNNATIKYANPFESLERIMLTHIYTHFFYGPGLR